MNNNELCFAIANSTLAFFGSVILFSYWYNAQKPKKQFDKGYMYLSIAIFIWFISSIASIITQRLGFFESFSGLISTTLSTINNGLILISIYYFEFRPKFIFERYSNEEEEIKPYFFSGSINSWRSFITIICLFIIVINIFLSQGDFTSELLLSDICFSIFTMIVLGITLFSSFSKRRLFAMAYISLILIIGMLIALGIIINKELIISKGFNKDEIFILSKLLLLGVHTGLIMIFISSMLGWVLEVSKIPEINEMKLHFKEVKNKLVVVVSIDRHFDKIPIDFTEAGSQFLSFCSFGIRKKYINSGIDRDKDLITPYPNRITKKIIKAKEDKFGRDDSTKKNSPISIALKKWPFLFDNYSTSSGKIALTVLPENIKIDSRLIANLNKKNLKLFSTNPKNHKSIEKDILWLQKEYKRCKQLSQKGNLQVKISTI